MSTKITTFETNNGKVEASTKEIKTFELPTVKKRNTGRAYKPVVRDDMYSRTLYKMFHDNEYLAYYDKPLTKTEIQNKLIAAHKHNKKLKQRLDKYLLTIGMFRQRYNEGTLFTSQPTTYLVSFEYDMCGYIVVGGRYPGTYRYFQDCYNKCISLKIADPRFIEYEKIVEIRNRQLQLIPEWLEWTVPDEQTLKTIRHETGVDELYNSVKFRPGFTREETPLNFVPLEE